jgi:type IV pilus assembly protein PilY1
MLHKYIIKTLSILAIAAVAAPAWAQSVAACTPLSCKEDFTGATTTYTWLSFNGACLTAGTGTNQSALPGCLNDTYYKNGGSTQQVQYGGANGYLGTSTGGAVPSSGASQSADPSGSGALRLTNGSALSNNFMNGFSQNGAILSSFNFPLDQGVKITFKTVTYGGNSGGNGGATGITANDGADGLSFFLLDDAVVTAELTTWINYPVPLDSGAFGGSLGYSCSNSNDDSTVRSGDGSIRGFDGVIGAYIGVGVDEYGNFLNPADNTATGPGLQAGRIGLRGAGSIAWKWLHQNYSTLYPSSWTTAQQAAAVQNTCHQGYLMDDYQTTAKNSSGQTYISQYGHYYTSTSSATPTSSSQSSGISVYDYPMITDVNGNGAYKILSLSSGNIAAEASLDKSGVEVPVTRANATPITYNVTITQDGKLSFSYSYSGGTWQPVISAVPITGSNGALPANVRFGFAGSDGSASNIHEILCFAAQPNETSASSGSINVYQNPTIRSGTQIFLANYYPSSWTGQLTAQTIGFSNGTIVANTTPNWDARCVLTGVDPTTNKCDTTGATSQTAEAWQADNSAVGNARALITWNSVNQTGVPLEWAGTSGGGITTAMGNIIDAGDSTQTATRLDYLRGDRTNEIGGTAKGDLNLYRNRLSVLGDIVDSSPTWVGPPQTYNNMNSWVDSLYGPGSSTPVTAPENSGQTYGAFQALYSANASATPATTGRVNVVYVGGNDGFLHGFRAGTLDQYGNLVTTNNDGQELLAYMPGTVFNAIHSTANVELDYPNTQYSHAWYVDATPGTGDVFYASSTGANSGGSTGTWHSWLVGGLGAGGSAIYALDITDPGTTFLESNASSLVIGEWSTTKTTTTTNGATTSTWTSNLTCQTPSGAPNSVSACGAQFLGNTYGTPLIRRFHNGYWGVIFGNGYSSQSGTAGIFIMLVNPSNGAKTFYYLPTKSTATGNGIGPTTSADFDGDHIIDYIYAGDLLGNVWRFDVTSPNPAKWAVSGSSPLFTAPSGQPITTAVSVSTLKTIDYNVLTGKVLDTKPQRVIINFGTGQQIAQTLTAATQYATGTQGQALYGVWDWDMGTAATPASGSTPASAGSGWNGLSSGQQGIGLPPGTGPEPIASTNLVSQTFTTGTGTRSITNPPAVVCWPVSTTGTGLNNPSDAANCTGKTSNYGWYMNLTTTTTNSVSAYEQVIFDPVVNADGLFIVNTYIPAPNSPLQCTPGTPTGWTMALEPDSGSGAPTGGYFVSSGGAAVDGVQLNGVGTPSFISTGSADNNTEFMLTQNGSGLATPTAVQRHSVVAGQRLNWLQRR